MLGSGISPRAPPRAWSWGSALVVPATAAAHIVPPVALPGVAGAAPALPLADGAGLLGPLPPRRRAPRLGREAAPRDAVPGQPHAHAPPASRPSAAERHLARAASRHARRHGPPPLLRPRLRRAARARCRAPARAGWRGRASARSIAWGCGTLVEPARDVALWLNSPPHRAILLGNARRAGVGVKRTGGCGGRAYWVTTSARRRARHVLPSGRLGVLAPARAPRRSRGPPASSPAAAHSAEHEQRDEVVASALAGDHRARQPVDQVLERQRLGDVARAPPARRSSS